MAKPRTLRQLAAVPLLMPLWSRLRRIITRLSCLPLPAPRPARPRHRAEPVERKPAAGRRLPRGTAWLLKVLPEAACFGSQLQYLLMQPEVAALLEADPRLPRMLRPLCRMLAVPASVLPPPARKITPGKDAAAGVGTAPADPKATMAPPEAASDEPPRAAPPDPPVSAARGGDALWSPIGIIAKSA